MTGICHLLADGQKADACFRIWSLPPRTIPPASIWGQGFKEQMMMRRGHAEPLTFICSTTVAETLCLRGIRAVVPGTEAKLSELIITCVFFSNLPELIIPHAASGAGRCFSPSQLFWQRAGELFSEERRMFICKSLLGGD